MKTTRLLALTVAAACAGLAAAQPTIQTVEFARGFTQPVAIIPEPGNNNRFYVVQQNGIIRVIENRQVLPTEFLNLVGLISIGGERGLLGLTFPPDYAQTGQFFVNFTNTAGATVIARFERIADNPPRSDRNTRLDILTIPQPFSNHNGGTLAFGPDGFLWIGMGDGGSGNDPGNRAQTRTDLLGDFLRIDPFRGPRNSADLFRNYRIPADNPYANGGPGLPEIWSWGWRNPWKFSFDNPNLGGTGAMVAADVGQNAWEEVNYEPRGRSNRNYGWRAKEGFAFTGLTGGIPPYTDPFWAYGRGIGQSVTGGYIYRGTRLGAFYFGRYFLGDFSSGRSWLLPIRTDQNGEIIRVQDSEVIELTAQLGNRGNISSFGESNTGELFLVSYGGIIYEIVPSGDGDGLGPGGMKAGRGGQLSGDVRATFQVDGNRLSLQPTPGRAFDGRLHMDFQVRGNPDRLRLDVHAATESAGNIGLRVGFRNPMNGSIEELPTVYRLSADGRSITIDGLVTKELANENGKIELVLRAVALGPVVSQNLRVLFDRIDLQPAN